MNLTVNKKTKLEKYKLKYKIRSSENIQNFRQPSKDINDFLTLKKTSNFRKKYD